MRKGLRKPYCRLLVEPEQRRARVRPRVRPRPDAERVRNYLDYCFSQYELS